MDKKYLLNLQMFASPGEEIIDAPEVDDVPDDLFTEDVGDEEADHTPENGQEEGLEDETPEAEDENTPDNQDEDTPPGEIKFSKEQQAKIDDIVKTRLDRAEARWERQLLEAAGTELDLRGGGEVLQSVRLWGLLKMNPQLSTLVQQTIDTYINQGKGVVQPKNNAPSREQLLEIKEARLDLRSQDTTFAKNEEAILDWAEEQGLKVTDKQSLNVAYLAWKGANSRLELANAQLREQRKAKEKATAKQKAVLEGSKGRGQGKLNYRSMSDADILRAEGLSLFSDE